jgi:hypothetical protein
MSEKTPMHRRRFLFVLGAGGLAAALLGGRFAKRRWDRTLAGRLAALLGDAEGPRTLGAAWLALNPGEGGRSKLVRGLLGDLGGFRARFLEAEELKNRVAERIRSEYAAGTVVQVEGWILSLTEIRLCALATATRPAGAGAPAGAPAR